MKNAENNGFLNWDYNPIEELSYTNNKRRNINLRLSTGLKYSFTDWLSAEIKYQYESEESNQRDLRSQETYFTRNLINRYSAFDGTSVTDHNIPLGAILTFDNKVLKSNNGRAQLNFNRNWTNHLVSALAGFEVRDIESEGYSDRFYGYDPDLGSSSPVNYTESYPLNPSGSNFNNIPGFLGVTGTVDRFRSYFANAAYTFLNRYTFSMSGRIDQSNLFGVNANQKSTPLWSVGGKWSMNEEKFYHLDILPLLRLRTTYGYSGNVDQNVTAFTTATHRPAGSSQRPAAVITNPPNPDLRWEQSRMLNIGLDFAFRNNVLSGSVEYYNKKSFDLMGNSRVDPTLGFTSYTGNVADMKGHGWDVQLNSVNVNRQLKWFTNILFSYTTDKVTKYFLPFNSNTLPGYFSDGSIFRASSQFVPTVGRPLFGIYSYRSAGLDPTDGAPRGFLNNEPSSNYAQIFSQSTVDSLSYHGRATPPVFGAIRNTVRYKGFTLSFNISYRFGYYFRRSSINYYSLFNQYDGHGDYASRWMQPGDEQHTNVPSSVYPADPNRDTFYNWSSVLVEKGDNIRLQDIQASYDWKQVALGKRSLQQIQLYAYLNNIGLLWRANHAGIDPDAAVMPLPRSYAFGIRILM